MSFYNDGTGPHPLSAPTTDQTAVAVPMVQVGTEISAGVTGPVTGTNPLPTFVTDAAGNANIGTAADAAWGGTGTSTVIAALKAIWTVLSGWIVSNGGRNALVTQQGGSLGSDYSANAASVPGSYLLATVPAAATRAGLVVQNQSSYQLQLVYDDGASGTPSSFFLAPAVVPPNGPIWAEAQHKGRVRIYCAQVPGAQVAVRVY
jgi:hypothetical protein